MLLGIAYDLRSDFQSGSAGPEDQLEEYDSQATVDAIAAALQASGYDTCLLGGGRRFIERVLAEPPDLVFNIAEGRGTRSREAHVPSVCEMLGIPITHSDPLTLSVALDKAMAKHVVAAAGVPVPACSVIETVEDLSRISLPYPLVAKPLYEGSSMGVRLSSRCTDFPALRQHVTRLLEDYGQPVLVEEFCSGPEFTVGILGNGPSAEVIGVMEIVPRNLKLEEFLYSLEVKRNFEQEVEYHVPPKRPAALNSKIEKLCLNAYRALGCRDVGRVDVRMSNDGEPRFLEVNPLPGLNPHSGDLVILSSRCALPYVQLLGRIVEHARARLSI